jgi:hypothetical protein
MTYKVPFAQTHSPPVLYAITFKDPDLLMHEEDIHAVVD